jgi:polyisoprenoid-binding protein YceI
MRRGVVVLSVCLASAVPARAAEQVYAVDPAASLVTITVGKAGLFKFAGHTHEVAVPVAEGRVVADADDVAASSVTLLFRSSDLKVTGKGEPRGDVPKVQAAMLGPKVLDAARFPTIAFRSTAVSGRPAGPDAWDVEVRGDLTLHGVTRPLVLPLRVERAGDALVARGTAALKQRDYGIEPVSVAGVVKVKDELSLEFRITALPAR